MTWFKNLSVGKKLFVAFFVILLLVVVLGGFALSALHEMDAAARDLSSKWLPGVDKSRAMQYQLVRLRTNQLAYLMAKKEDREATNKQIVIVGEAFEQVRKSYDTLSSTQDMRDIYGKVINDYNLFSVATNKMIDALKENRGDDAVDAGVKEARSLLRVALEDADKLVQLNTEGAKASVMAAEQSYANARTIIILVLVVVIALALALGVFLRAAIAKPLVDLDAAMGRLAQHDTGTPIPATDRKDEVGAMARAVLVFKDSMLEADRLNAQQSAEHAERERRAASMTRLTQEFDAAASSMIDTVATAAGDMQTTASSLSAVTGKTSQQAATVATAAQEASTNVQTVASAAEELSSSIHEISRQVAQASHVSQKAVDQANQTSDIIGGLETAARQIGEVVSLINGIASQTNLLALNATIEAARAGDAGKGFAVVANEVKSLANQTARATEDISQQIASVQQATAHAVAAIGTITGTIQEIDEISAAVAAAVEEQGAATKEIARNVEQAAIGTETVTANIEGVNRSVTDTGHSANDVLTASSQLLREAEQMRGLVRTFLGKVRAT
ncbi:MAG TPA: methyl-accepting chemotaxis protein [Telmatospirillum sp.]|nr:methyl-accepting chemotaxis protein [Telmatospirillum sp.]